MTMRFEHEFTVPVPIEQAWSVLLDVERVAPCLPGAALDTVDGDVFTGRMKVKVGPITVTYRGEASFQAVDKDAHSLSITASGKEARGTGTASAVVTATLTAEGSHTKVNVETSFNVTGRPAQFGRGVMAEIGAKLIDRFATNLATVLREAPEETGAAALPEGAALAPATQDITPPPAEEPAVTPFNEPSAAARPDETADAVALDEPAAAASPDQPNGGRHLSAVPDAFDPSYAEETAGREAHPARTPRSSLTAEEQELDLLAIAGVPLLKRLVPALAGLGAVVFLGWLVRRLLSRR